MFTNYDNIKKIVSDQNLVKNTKDIYANYIKNIGDNIKYDQNTFDVDLKTPSKVDIESARERLKKAEQNNNGSPDALKELDNASALFTHLNNERLNHQTMDKEKKNFISNLYNVYGARSGTGSYNISDMKERQKEMIGTIAELLDEHARQCMAPPGGDCKNCPCPGPDGPPKCDTLFQTRNIEPNNTFRKMAVASIICFLIAYILVKIVNNINGRTGYPKYITIFDKRAGGGGGAAGTETMKVLRHDNGIFNIRGPKNQDYQLNTLFPFITNKYLLKSPLGSGSYPAKFCNPGILIYAILFGLYSGYMVNDIKNDSDTPTKKSETSAQKGIKWTFTIIIALTVSGLLLFTFRQRIGGGNIIQKIGIVLGSILAGVISGVIVYNLAQSMTNVQNDKQCGSMKYVLTGCYLAFSVIYLLSLKFNNFDGLSSNILPILRNVFLIALFAMNHSFNAILIRYFPGIWVSWMIIQKVILSLFTNLSKFMGLPNDLLRYTMNEYRDSTITKVLGSMGALRSNGANFQFLLDPLLYGIANGFGIDFFLNAYQPGGLNRHDGGWVEQFQTAMFFIPGPPPIAPVNISINQTYTSDIGVGTYNVPWTEINPIQPIPMELIGTDFVI